MNALRSALSAILVATPALLAAQTRSAAYTIDQFLSPASPLEVSAARKADKLAWVTYEKGMRNIHVASAPSFKAARITNFMNDDGVDVGSVRLSEVEQVQQQIVDVVRKLEDAGEITVHQNEEAEEFIQ